MHIRPARLIAVGLISALAACSSGNGSGMQDPNNGTQLTPSHSEVASVPGSLPTFKTDGSNTVQAMQQLLQLAAQNAVGVPNEDHNPNFVVTTGSSCGVKVASNVCPPNSATGPVIIFLNPDVAWKNFLQPAGYGGGDAPWQNDVIASVINYMMFRHWQRTNPQMLTNTSESDAEAIFHIQDCKTGNVIGALKKSMSPELSAMYTRYSNSSEHPDFGKGVAGKC